MKKIEVSFTSTFTGLSGFPNGVGEVTTSPSVELEETLWSVRIYPGGVDDASKGFMSCFIGCETQNVQKSTRASFRISILNQKGWKNHHFLSESVKTFDSISRWGDPKFVSTANMNNATNGMCVDDKVIIRVELTIYGPVEQFYHSPNLHAQMMGAAGGGASLAKKSMIVDLKNLLYDESLKDITIVAGERSRVENVDDLGVPGLQSLDGFKIGGKDDNADADEDGLDASDGAEDSRNGVHIGVEEEMMMNQVERFTAHKFILSMRSPVFRAMFAGSMREAVTNEVTIPDVQPVVMREFLHFLYTDICSPDMLVKHAEKLLAAACKYEVAGLEALCENYLYESLDSANAGTILYIADLYGAQQLKERALHFIAHNAKSVVQTEGFFDTLSSSLCREVLRAVAGAPSSTSSSSASSVVTGVGTGSASAEKEHHRRRRGGSLGEDVSVGSVAALSPSSDRSDRSPQRPFPGFSP